MKMHINLLLMVMVLISGMFAINTQYEVRKLYTALDLENKSLSRLNEEYERLKLERSELSSQQIMEKKARSYLQMIPISPEQTFHPNVEVAAAKP